MYFEYIGGNTVHEALGVDKKIVGEYDQHIRPFAVIYYRGVIGGLYIHSVFVSDLVKALAVFIGGQPALDELVLVGFFEHFHKPYEQLVARL